MKPEIKAELLRELALEMVQAHSDRGMRAGIDPFHPLHRGRPVVSFACFDALGIHAHPQLTAAIIKGVHEAGGAAGVGRASGAITAALMTAEQRLATFFASESALIFSSRNQCVLTAITAVCGEGVVVMGHALTTLPIADACALVGAEFVEFESEEQLRISLLKYASARRIVVVLDGVSAISGEIRAISTLLTAIEHVGGWAFIDETTGIGWRGMRGAGSAESVLDSPALVGRIVGFQGLAGSDVCGLVCSQELRELLQIRSRYLKIEPPPPDWSMRLIIAALDIVEVALSQRDKLAARTLLARRAIAAQGWRLIGSEGSPILSLWFESLHKAVLVQEALLQRGLFVEALAARSLRRNGAVVRAIVSNAHRQEEVERLLLGLDEVFKRLKTPSIHSS